MAINVVMPQMGESVFEGTLTKWLKKTGDFVQRDEPLFEISTDKVDSEIPSPATGILAEILVPEGKTVQINSLVAVIKEADEDVKSRPEAAAKEEKPEPLSEKPGVPMAAPLIHAAPPKAEATKNLPAAPAYAGEQSPGIRLQDIRTSPLVRRLARENNVDLSLVQGTGMQGRITKDDLLAYVALHSGSAPAQQTAGQTGKAPSEGVSETSPVAQSTASMESTVIPVGPRFIGESETVTMSPMRKAIAEHMVFSKRTSAHVNTVFEIDVTGIVRLREENKTNFEKMQGIALTYTPFFAKALTEIVTEFPIVNTSVVGDSILYKKPVNLGIAVALDSGLIVPVVKDAHLKSFTELALAIQDLADRARTKRLKPDEVQNGTISMTNPGRYGSLFNTPIISQPQVAILGLGGIEKRPVVINDAIAIRSMVCVSLTFDHRVIDGAVADQFMARLKARLQAWTQWMD